MKIDLALPTDQSQPSPNGDEGSQMPQYPSMTIMGDAASQLGADKKPGDEFQAQVTLRVVNNQDGQMDLEVVDLDNQEEAQEQPEENGGQALDSYLSTKGAPAGAGMPQ